MIKRTQARRASQVRGPFEIAWTGKLKKKMLRYNKTNPSVLAGPWTIWAERKDPWTIYEQRNRVIPATVQSLRTLMKSGCGNLALDY